jgi:hypothetical protein
MTVQKTLISTIGLALLVGLVVSFSSCASPTTPDSSMTFISTTVNSHFHTITLTRSELEAPWDAIWKTTSMAMEHTHRLLITGTDQSLIISRPPRTLYTEIAPDNHFHAFTISIWW